MPGSFLSLLQDRRDQPLFKSALSQRARVPRASAMNAAAAMQAPVAPPREPSDAKPIPNTGRRAAARLRLSIPAKIVTIYATTRCVLLDLSRSGAQIGIQTPLDVGDPVFLRFVDYEVFATVKRRSEGANGLEFEGLLEEEIVLRARRYAETFEDAKRRALMDDVRAWVNGARRY